MEINVDAKRLSDLRPGDIFMDQEGAEYIVLEQSSEKNVKLVVFSNARVCSLWGAAPLVCCVDSGGGVDFDVCGNSKGVRPFFILDSSIFVSLSAK